MRFYILLFGLLLNYSQAFGANFYYKGVDGVWDTVGNWFSNAGFTTPAGALPNTGDVVSIGDATVSGTGNINTGPSVVKQYASVIWVGLDSFCGFDFSGYNGTVTFSTPTSTGGNSGTVNTAIFTKGYNEGTCTTATFNSGSFNNAGGVCTTATFNTGRNGNGASCTTATFNSGAYNDTGATCTTAFCNDTFTNDGVITTATFTGTARNLSGNIGTVKVTITRNGNGWKLPNPNFQDTSAGGSVTTVTLLGVPDGFAGAILAN